MPLPGWGRRRRISVSFAVTTLSLVALVLAKAGERPLLPTDSERTNLIVAGRNWLPDSTTTKPRTPAAVDGNCPRPSDPDPLLGARTRMPGSWQGLVPVSEDLPIVVMAGHADSQAMDGAGTPGYAVDVLKQAPMDARMRDELFWNFKVQDAVVRLGQERGLNISRYVPPSLTIRNHADPATNWSQAKQRSARGEYVVEIHFDAYSPYGFGSGLIPAVNRRLNTVDESLAESFGRFPRLFRGGLGGPRRGIGILEIGMLQGPLERGLRDPQQRDQTVECLALRVVDALVRGVGRS
jgi:hypothetical protein